MAGFPRRAAALACLAVWAQGLCPGAAAAEADDACACDLSEGSPWAALAEASRCWEAARKLPPQLYTAANDVFSGMKAGTADAESCPAGAFTALLALLLLWEAHDAPDELIGSALQPAKELHRIYLAPAAGGARLDCGSAPGAWPGAPRLETFARLEARLARQWEARRQLEAGSEAWHPREVAERGRVAAGPRDLCLCVLHGEGAATVNATLASYQAGGLLQMAHRRFVVFLNHADESDALSEEVACWRERLARRYRLEPLLPSSEDWPDPFIKRRKRSQVSPGTAMAACAAACDAEHIIFLEDDFELVTRAPDLVRHRLLAAMDALQAGGSVASDAPLRAPVLGAHLRHKLLFGAPFYELVTAAQHNEPPSPYAAWYFSEDPVASRFPDGLWEPPFWDSRGACDSERRSWHTTLAYQRGAAAAHEQARAAGLGPPGAPANASGADEELAARVWWCSPGSSVLCASTAAHRDPFRSLMYSTNPMLYRTAAWQLHMASYAAVLQDLRAVEESVSTSYTWRVEPSFTLALSLGLFRHRRLDRDRLPPPEKDADAAACRAQHPRAPAREAQGAAA